MVPASLKAFAFRKCKDEVEQENLRLRASKAAPAWDDGAADGLPNKKDPKALKGNKGDGGRGGGGAAAANGK